ncbi:hypothetical protein PEKONANI_00942 [Aeromonas jandaei]
MPGMNGNLGIGPPYLYIDPPNPESPPHLALGLNVGNRIA